jgi:hypothetical protein
MMQRLVGQWLLLVQAQHSSTPVVQHRFHEQQLQTQLMFGSFLPPMVELLTMVPSQ